VARFFNSFRSFPVLLFLLADSSPAQLRSVKTFALNHYLEYLDGQWEGIRYASDGNVYFGSSTHSAHHGAAFFQYSPATGKLRMLADDLTKVCGEDPSVNPQGKLHSDIVEANGWLYMSTHFSSELPGAYDHWSGSHLIGYQLSTGKFRDFGVVHPNYDNYSAIGVDPKRNYAYLVVTGLKKPAVAYLYRINVVTGEKKNLGKVGAHFATGFYMFVDRRGDVWFSMLAQNGELRHVHGDTGVMDVYENALPPLVRWDKDEVDPDPKHQRERGIMWIQPLDGDRAVFTVGHDGGVIYIFDSTQPIGSGREFRRIRHIGFSDLGLAVGAGRVFYYQRANRGYGEQADLTPDGIRDFHLLSVSLDPADGYAITDHGLLRDRNGRLLWRAPGMATDGRNRVFMIGDWWTIPGDAGSRRYHFENGRESYVKLDRGEFFAVTSIEPPRRKQGTR
jgi:hypothetical protein